MAEDYDEWKALQDSQLGIAMRVGYEIGKRGERHRCKKKLIEND